MPDFGLGPRQPDKTKKPTPADRESAARLLDAARGYLGPAHPRIAKAKVSKWAEHFRLLREVDDIDADAVLNWYCASIGGQYTPHVFSAERFRSRYWDLHDAYERERGTELDWISIFRASWQIEGLKARDRRALKYLHTELQNEHPTGWTQEKIEAWASNKLTAWCGDAERWDAIRGRVCEG